MGQMASSERRSGKTYESGALASWHQVQLPGVANTDESLIQRINSRDESALAILYDRYTTMIYSVVRPILAEEAAAREIIPQVFYRIWLKASDFKPAVTTVKEFMVTTARKCAFDQFLGCGFESGALLTADPRPPAYNVELMARVRKIMAELPPLERGPQENGKPEVGNWARSDRRMEQLINGLKGKMRATLKALTDHPLGTPNSDKRSKKEKS